MVKMGTPARGLKSTSTSMMQPSKPTSAQARTIASMDTRYLWFSGDRVEYILLGGLVASHINNNPCRSQVVAWEEVVPLSLTHTAMIINDQLTIYNSKA
jgi:hypothetical protein